MPEPARERNWIGEQSAALLRRRSRFLAPLRCELRNICPTLAVLSLFPSPLLCPFSLSPNYTMLSRACLRGFGLQSLPKRQAYQLARRTVTTDAASSHAEKDDVPEVSKRLQAFAKGPGTDTIM